MKNTKRMKTAVLAVALALSLTACGKNPTVDEKSTESSAQTTSELQSSTQTGTQTEKTKVTLWTNVTEDSPQAVKDIQADLEQRIAEKFPDYEVEFIPKVYTDYNQDYDKALMAGNAPDAFDMFSYTAIPTRIDNGTIADITDLVKDWDMKKEDKVINTFDKVICEDGKWYAIPRSAYTMALYVNKKAILAGGENPDNLPKTWDEFDKYCQNVTDKSVPRFGYEIMGMEYCAWAFTPWVWSAGGEMVEKTSDGKWRIAFADDPGVDAACYLNKLVNDSKVTQTNILCSLSDTDKDMISGKACFAWGTITNATASELGQYGYEVSDFTQMCMPAKADSIENPALAGGEVITFNPKIDKKTMKAAFDVMSYMYYDEDYQKIKWQATYDNGSNEIQIPARKDLYEEKLAMNPFLTDDVRENIKMQATVSKPEPYCEHWADVKSQLVIPLQKIYLLQNADRDQIKKILDDCANELCKLYPDTFVR